MYMYVCTIQNYIAELPVLLWFASVVHFSHDSDLLPAAIQFAWLVIDITSHKKTAYPGIQVNNSMGLYTATCKPTATVHVYSIAQLPFFLDNLHVHVRHYFTLLGK